MSELLAIERHFVVNSGAKRRLFDMKKIKYLIAVCIFFTVMLASASSAQQLACPACQKSFPADYKYCPYCARALHKNTDALPKDIVVNSIGMELRYIHPGEFLMGSASNKEDGQLYESRQHLVKLTKAFYTGVTEVTQAQWIKIMKTRPWSGKEYVREGDSYPAVFVSWNDAAEFCRRLSEEEGRRYRLPTEGEWEYACRAGTKTGFSFGDDKGDDEDDDKNDDPNRLRNYAWFEKNAWEEGEKYAHIVAEKKPNPWGLYDIHGNVWEWCSDWHGDYPTSPMTDPKGPSRGKYRILRGGSWRSTRGFCRSADRFWNKPEFWGPYYGFRIVMDLK